LWRDLLNIPEEYAIFFVGGGASTQFFQVPANLLKTKAQTNPPSVLPIDAAIRHTVGSAPICTKTVSTSSELNGKILPASRADKKRPM
ncbi:MAG: hypothetical protein IIU59_05140, partial [Alistipes sp.]|nr:hypothetical protein [Alistipes sp.]